MNDLKEKQEKQENYPVADFIGENILQPISNFIGETMQSALYASKPLQEAIKKKEYHRIPLTLLNSMTGIAFAPMSVALSKVPLIAKIAPYTDLTHTRSFLDPKFYTDSNYKYLEHDYSDISPFLNDAITAIGNTKYAYPGWVAKNLSQRGRYTLDNLPPAGYTLKGKVVPIVRMLAEPFYKNPPHFTNGKRPKWTNLFTEEVAESRFLNGEIWAGIRDQPLTLFKENSDGTYRIADAELADRSKIAASVDFSNFYPGKSLEEASRISLTNVKPIHIIEGDFFTKGKIGGEHSDFTYYPKYNFGLFEDVLKLNPLWKLTHPIKMHFKAGSIPYKFLDKLGGANMSRILGYKKFKYRHPFAIDYNGNVIPEPSYFIERRNSIIPEHILNDPDYAKYFKKSKK